MNSISVFCGSSKGISEVYSQAASVLASELVQRNITIVYGGAKVGLMGVVADRALELGGRVIGVMPEKLISHEVAHDGLSELIIVRSMHERKYKMHLISDAFIALPGGFGTLDEIFEMITWAQLKIHSKPCGFLNTNGYFNHLHTFLDHVMDEGFLAEGYRNMVLNEEDPSALLNGLETYLPPSIDKARIALGKEG